MNPCIKKAIVAVTAILFILIISVFVFIKPLTQLGLRHAGFKDAVLEGVRVTPNSAVLHSLTLPVHGLSASNIRASFKSRHISFDKIEITVPALAAFGVPLALPAGMEDARVTLGPGTVTQKDTHYILAAPVVMESSIAHITGLLNAEIDKAQGHAAKASLEIAEGKITHPNIEIKRLQGWLSAETGTTVIADGQITAGAFKLYGLPLQGSNVSFSYKPEKTTLIANADVAGNAGNILVDVAVAGTALSARAEAKLKNLSSLGVKGLEGAGEFILNLAGARKDSVTWTEWNALEGSGNISAAHLSLPGLVENAEASAKTTMGYDPATKKITLALDVEKARAGNRLPWIVPFRMQAAATPKSGVYGINGKISEKNGLFAATFKGTANPVTGASVMDIDLPPVTLRKGVTELKDISPISVGYMQDTNGEIGFSARIARAKTGAAMTGSGKLLLKDFSFVTDGTVVSNVNTVLMLASLSPVRIDKNEIAIGALTAGAPLTDGRIVFSLDGDALTVHDTTWTLAKGKLSAAPFTMALKDKAADILITAASIDLPELFKMIPMEGIDATGTAGGTLPVTIRGDSIALTGGVLQTEGKGDIRYNPQSVPAFLADESNKQIADLRIALKAFEYETLKLTIDGEIGKNQKIGLHISGKNPLFYGGHPVNLNLNVEGPLQSILKYNPGGSQIPDSIQRQIESYEKEQSSTQ